MRRRGLLRVGEALTKEMKSEAARAWSRTAPVMVDEALIRILLWKLGELEEEMKVNVEEIVVK